jgi:hypothetical protein
MLPPSQLLYVPLTVAEVRAARTGATVRATPTASDAPDARPAYGSYHACKARHPSRLPVALEIAGKEAA